jgi:hypothetical protein
LGRCPKAKLFKSYIELELQVPTPTFLASMTSSMTTFDVSLCCVVVTATLEKPVFAVVASYCWFTDAWIGLVA